MRRVIRAVAAGSEIGDLSTLEDGASVDEVRAAISALIEAEAQGRNQAPENRSTKIRDSLP